MSIPGKIRDRRACTLDRYMYVATTFAIVFINFDG